MPFIYIEEHGSKISKENGRFIIKNTEEVKAEVPIETVDGIMILSESGLTTPCIKECLNSDIPVSFLSSGGRYYGKLVSVNNTDASLQRKQALLYDTDFALQFSKNIITAKIKNQRVVMNRYAKSTNNDLTQENIIMKSSCQKIKTASEFDEIRGYEGIAARSYFQGLSKCVKDEFKFQGRSRRPPKDPFNAVISFGYSMLLNDIWAEIEARKLNGYFGFMHRDALNHPALASDLMEEWRSILIDSTAMSLINGNEIYINEFNINTNNSGVYMEKECRRKVIDKIHKKFHTSVKYLSYIDYSVTMRRAVAFQINQLVKAIEAEDPELYKPVIIR